MFFGEIEKKAPYPLNSGTSFKEQQKLENQLDMNVKNDYYRKKMQNKKSLIDSSFDKLAA